jgi:hypothetical protein
VSYTKQRQCQSVGIIDSELKDCVTSSDIFATDPIEIDQLLNATVGHIQTCGHANAPTNMIYTPVFPRKSDSLWLRNVTTSSED